MAPQHSIELLLNYSYMQTTSPFATQLRASLPQLTIDNEGEVLSATESARTTLTSFFGIETASKTARQVQALVLAESYQGAAFDVLRTALLQREGADDRDVVERIQSVFQSRRADILDTIAKVITTYESDSAVPRLFMARIKTLPTNIGPSDTTRLPINVEVYSLLSGDLGLAQLPST